MQKHIKVYLEHFWEIGLCENCENAQIVDIHHIQPRSSFWKKTKYLQDIISNLIGLCRICHKKAHFQIEPYLTKEDLHEIRNPN